MQLSQLFYLIAAPPGSLWGGRVFRLLTMGSPFGTGAGSCWFSGSLWFAPLEWVLILKVPRKRQAEAVQVSLKADPVKSKYLGQWNAPRGKASIEIYEENGGLFAKFWQGDIMPLKYQEEGQYYEGSTALGAMPFIIRNDTLQCSHSKYNRVQD